MYKLIFHKDALRFFNKLDKFTQEKIGKKIEKLIQNPFLGKSLMGNFSGSRSLRIGKYRVIYQVKQNELIIFVLDVGRRKNIY